MSKNCKNNCSDISNSCCSAKVSKPKKLGAVKLIIAVILSIPVCLISMVPGWHMQAGALIFNTIALIPGVSLPAITTTIQVLFISNLLMLVLTFFVQYVCGARFIVGTFKAIGNRHLDMNVLVFVGTTIAFLMSLYITFEPLIINEWAKPISSYVNSAMPFYETCCMLVCFIYLGQVIEARAKRSTVSVVEELKAITPKTANVIDGYTTASELLEGLGRGDRIVVSKKPISEVKKLNFVLVCAGETVPVDGMVIGGRCQSDESMITGESEPAYKAPGSDVVGGTECISGKVIIQVANDADNGVLSKIINAVTQSQSSKAPVARTADKVASIFVPLVLIVALLSFGGWFVYGYITDGFVITSNNLINALMCGVSVSVVSCACSLALATPTALSVGMGIGAKKGIIIKDGVVLESMCKLKHIIFDKTGTLTLAGVGHSANSMNTIRPEATHTINDLQTKFKLQTYMLSGDNANKAFAVADQLGVPRENVVYGSTPIDKKNFIDNLKQNISTAPKKSNTASMVAFVGDGVNDAPALVAADIGITLESGTNIALDSGNVVLMHNNLSDICMSIRLSKATMRKIKQNLFWALIYNVVMIPLAAFGIVLPAIAACCHAISSILVVINSLTLKRFK